MIRPLLIIVAALVLAACPGSTTKVSPEVQTFRTLLATCNGYNRAIVALAGLNAAGSLSQSQVDTVDGIRPLAALICNSDKLPSNMTVALDSIEGYLLRLLIIQQKAAPDGTNINDVGNHSTDQVWHRDNRIVRSWRDHKGRAGTALVYDAREFRNFGRIVGKRERSAIQLAGLR